MAAPDKDTIYIDVDDEITAIIDKVRASKSKIVALVLPKRAAVLQSVVNMKLLKKAAHSANKNLVLITSEASLLPLAGVAGVHVAKNLQSKPEIPPKPGLHDHEEELSEKVPAPSDDEVDASKSVGELATKSSGVAAEDTIEVDNSSSDKPVGAKKSTADKAKSKKNKQSKIPNFERFRKRLFIGAGVFILLLAFWYVAAFKMPKATITVVTDTTSESAQITFVADPAATTASTEGNIVPVKVAQSEKNEVQTAPTTGTKDVGTKASGSIKMSIPCAQVGGTPPTIPAGTGVSSNSLTFITQKTVTLSTPEFSGGCKFVASTDVVAQANGDQYNVSARSYTVNGYANVTAQGTEMTGGTSKVIKVVTQSDIDAATAKLTADDNAAKEQLKKSLESDGYQALTDTFVVKDVVITASPNVDQEGAEVTVTSKGTYQMIGVKEDDLNQVVDAAASKDLDSNKQQVQDNGLDSATYRVTKAEPNGMTTIVVNTQITIGPKFDEAELKTEIAGKKSGDTENVIKAIPGVKEVTVKYSPFWVSKTPKNPDKITFVFEKAE